MKRWIQYNVRLARRAGSPDESARSLFGSLHEPLQRWRRERSLDCFYFMRKPPGVRMRFHGTDVARELSRILTRLNRARSIGRFFTSIYEPEVHLFGGERAMALVHAHFDADTRAWMAGGSPLIPALLDDLFLTTLQSRTETWDVWWNLWALMPKKIRDGATNADIRPLESASAEEGQLVADYRRANERFAKGFNALQDRGELECGMRAALAFVAMFTFNRHGFDGAKQACFARTFIETNSPHRGLRK